MPAIYMEDVSKSYDGKRRAVDRVSIAVPEGTVFGFLGPNGAGKTTTVKLLGGLLAPDEGQMLVAGSDPVHESARVHAASALMTETTMMYDHLTAKENLLFFGRLFGMEDARIRARSEELLRRVGLTEAKGPLKTFSTGMRQRLSLARTLLNEPKVLFLDEPTSGLDPESVKDVNAIIAEQAARGATVFLCTHQLRYAEELCTGYGLMDRGRLLAAGTFAELLQKAGKTPRAYIRADGLPEGLMTPVAEGVYEQPVANEADIARLVAAAVGAGSAVYEVGLRRDTLEDVYFALLKEDAPCA